MTSTDTIFLWSHNSSKLLNRTMPNKSVSSSPYTEAGTVLSPARNDDVNGNWSKLPVVVSQQRPEEKGRAQLPPLLPAQTSCPSISPTPDIPQLHCLHLCKSYSSDTERARTCVACVVPSEQDVEVQASQTSTTPTKHARRGATEELL